MFGFAWRELPLADCPRPLHRTEQDLQAETYFDQDLRGDESAPIRGIANGLLAAAVLWGAIALVFTLVT